MAWYRRAKLGRETISKAFSSKIFVPRSPIRPPVSRISGNTSLIRCNTYTSAANSGSSFSSRLGLFNGLIKTDSSLNGFGKYHSSLIPKRNYYVDRNQVHHFRARGYRKWFENPRHVFIAVILGSGTLISIYFGNLETIPYTKRKHFVLLSRSLEKRLGESQFQELKKEFRGSILPAIHPDSIRVRLIAKDVIEALQRGLSHEQFWSDPGYASETSDDDGFRNDGHEHETLMALTEGHEAKAGRGWRREDEILDDSWIKESKRKGDAKGVQPSTQHLEGLNWEIVVVNEPTVNAFCLPGGKIVVFTGLLKHFRSDAEIATIIGHEVGHAVARHAAEQLTKNMWFAIIQLVLYQFVMPDIVNTMSTLFLRLPFSRKMEIEADYIGILLLASAGFDPRVAPTVYEKLGKVTGGESMMRDYLSTHPSGKKRAELLANAEVMKEAMNVYREIRAGHGIEGFL